jgi:hypothetical protein
MVQWLTNAGKKVLYVSFQGLISVDAFLDRAREAALHIKRSGGHVLVIFDFSGEDVTADYFEGVKGIALSVSGLVDKRAYVGFSGNKVKILGDYIDFMGVAGASRIFSRKEDAIAWLTA